MNWSFRARRLAEASGAEEVAHCSLLFAGAPIIASGGGGGGGGGPSLPGELTRWTVTNNTASPMTNIPIEVPIQFSAAGGPATMESNACIQIVDNDGTTVIPVQEWGRYSDLAGPNIRGMHKMVCILPALGASQKRELTVVKLASTSPTTGTDITAAEILATGFTLPASLAHKNGTTYTADAATGLAASTWTNKTTACNKGKWVQGGGFATSYVVTCPFKNGGTAAPNNLTLWAEITAYKAQRGAVSGGNPIIAIRVQYWVKSAFAQATGQTNHWFDLSTSCGSNSQNWVGATPSKTITMSAYIDPTYGAQPVDSHLDRCTFTVGTGGTTFTANSVGMVIADGTGQAVIVKYNNADSVDVRIVHPFGSTTVSSGTWRTWGLYQQFGSDIPKQEIWYNGGLAISAQPDIDSSLGVAWTGSAGGPFNYLRDCKMILPYTTPYTSITNSLAQLTGVGNNPCANVQGAVGDWTAYMPATGGRDDIAPIPGFYVGPLIKWDSNAKQKIMINAIKFGMYPMFYIDENTGKAPQFDSATNWFMSSDNWTGTRLPQATKYITGGVEYEMTSATFQVAHHPGVQAVPIMLTGDFYHVEQLHEQLFACYACCDPGYQGYGMNRMFCNASEFRGNAWTYRDISAAILYTPDGDNPCLSYTRSHMTTILGNQFTNTGSGTPGVPQYPGVNLGLVNNTGPGKPYATSGYRAMGQSINTDVSQWQLGYALFGFYLSKYLGMATGDFDAFITWMTEGIVGAATSSDVNLNWFIPIYYGRTVTNSLTPVNSWADTYKWSGFDMLNGSARRLITGTGITLSALSGTGITVTMPAGYFTTGQSFYIGCPVVDINAASLQVTPMELTSRAGFDTAAQPVDCAVTSISTAIATLAWNGGPLAHSGTLKIWNNNVNPLYVKLSNGASTATTGDTLIAPGTYVKFTVGSNTHINHIVTGGYGSMLVYGSSGAGFNNGDTITLSIQDAASNFSISQHAQVTVSDVGVNGDVVAVTISTPGLYIANTAGSNGAGKTLTQTATSGVGTGFTFKAANEEQSVYGQSPLRFGVGIVTGISGDVLTLATNSSWRDFAPPNGTNKCYPFAQTSLVSNKIRTGAPAIGDNNGVSPGIAEPHLPTPYSGTNEYWTIAINTAKIADILGYTNAATAYANIAAKFTGPNELKWRVV